MTEFCQSSSSRAFSSIVEIFHTIRMGRRETWNIFCSLLFVLSIGVTCTMGEVISPKQDVVGEPVPEVREIRDAPTDETDKTESAAANGSKSEATPTARRRYYKASCLKEETMILLADWTEIPVESLKIGDMVMDHNLRPTAVTAVSGWFLHQSSFYGFDNSSFFFTDTHMMVGPSDGGIRMYAKDTSKLFATNPLIKYLDIQELTSDHQVMYYFHPDGFVQSKRVQVRSDPVTYPESTLVYFIQVDSPSGTYFANGYASRHETPPIQFWPNTVSVLFSTFHKISELGLPKIPYLIENLSKFSAIAHEVVQKIEHILTYTSKEDLIIGPIMDLDLAHGQQVLGTIFQDPSVAAIQIEIYARIGKVMASLLDNPLNCESKQFVGALQNRISDGMFNQYLVSVSNHFNI